MTGYRSASYQQDVMDELAHQAQVHFYGPGFSEYDVNDSINDVLDKVPFEPDFIILGHAWLNDKDGAEVDPHPKLQLAKTAIPKIAILNKEYTNLSAKLNYFKKNQFDMGFTHHLPTLTATQKKWRAIREDERRFSLCFGYTEPNCVKTLDDKNGGT